ncbi:hypothetical protein KCP74_22470 [Salmonella enterica subsp. enterica]|nr:hypothetical protein KCP74_22470 [Salmonella enterica subsp. enterica]
MTRPPRFLLGFAPDRHCDSATTDNGVNLAVFAAGRRDRSGDMRNWFNQLIGRTSVASAMFEYRLAVMANSSGHHNPRKF